ncbi:MAG: SLATT domain-containing protein [Myxococcales bacterium]
MAEQSGLQNPNVSAAVDALDAARANPPKDVSHIPLRAFASKSDEGVETAYKQALRRASEAVVWYQRAKDRKRRPAIGLRFLAIVIGGLGTVTPIVVSMLSDPLGKRLLPSASMFAAIAVGCVALDKFFGFSSGWIRYMSAMLELQDKIESFEFAWARERVKRAASSATAESQAADLDMIAAFVASISRAIRTETEAWAAEFKTVLAGQETALEAQRNATSIVARRRGALKVLAGNVDALDGQQWQIRLDDDPAEPISGQVAAINDVEEGIHRIRATAKKGGSEVRAEDVVNIKNGEVTALTLSFA